MAGVKGSQKSPCGSDAHTGQFRAGKAKESGTHAKSSNTLSCSERAVHFHAFMTSHRIYHNYHIGATAW